MFEISYFSIKVILKKKDLEMNALSQHTKPKAAYAQRRGAINFCPSFGQLLFTQAW